MYFDLFVKRIEGNVTLLLQCRNLTGYALASSTGHEVQTVITQISQRLNVAIGGLTSIFEEIRRHNPEPEQKPVEASEQPKVNTDVIMQYLTKDERLDLAQLEHSFDELNIMRDLVRRFSCRLLAIGEKRQATDDGRGRL